MIMRDLVLKWATVMVACMATLEVADAAPFTMACTVQVAPGLVDPTHGRVVNLPMLVSPEQGTVNSSHAAITNSLITWTDNSAPKSEALSYILDRSSLALSIYDAAGARLLAGTCVAPPAQPVQQRDPEPSPAHPQPFTLACRFAMLGPLTSGHTVIVEPSFFVDPITGTVNGLPANITAAQIRWDETVKGAAQITVINRITGGAGVLLVNGTPLLLGSCALATARKF